MKRLIKVSTVLLLMLLMFTACSVPGKKYDSVEAYYLDNQAQYDEVKKTVQDELGDDLQFEMIFKDNTLTYQYTFPTNIDQSAFSSIMNSQFEQQDAQFQEIANKLKKESGVEDCIVIVSMLNPNGEVLIEKEYTAE